MVFFAKLDYLKSKLPIMNPNSTISKLLFLFIYALFLIPFIYYIGSIAYIISLIGLGLKISYAIAFILGIVIIFQLPKLIGYLVNIYEMKTHKNPALKKQKPPLKKE